MVDSLSKHPIPAVLQEQSKVWTKSGTWCSKKTESLTTNKRNPGIGDHMTEIEHSTDGSEVIEQVR